MGRWVKATLERADAAAPEWVIQALAGLIGKYRRARDKASVTLPWSMVEAWAAPLLIAALVLLFYAVPVVSPNASIQGDAADVQYPLQRYFAERMLTGIPFWSPYVLSGYPILANPEMQAWYPLNWPFYLGYGPRSVEFELALHAFLACLGAYLFFSRLGLRSSASMLGGLGYGLSGYFSGHSSQVPVFMSAAWFPWLLWAYHRAMSAGWAPLRERALSSGPWAETGTRGSAIAKGALAGGALMLCGSYQIAVLCFLGLQCYAAVDAWKDDRRARRSALVCTGIVAGAIAISAIQLLPAAQLIRHSAPDPADASRQILSAGSLATLIFPNATGAISHTGKALDTGNYFYAGLLLLPLAIVGAVRSRHRVPAAVLAAFGLLYMLGRWGGLYWLGTRIGGGAMSGPPDLAWFAAAFALAWLGAAGSDWLFQHVRLAGVLIVALLFTDLWYWNMQHNPLAFARSSFGALYGDAERRLAPVLGQALVPLTRFDARGPVTWGGPMLHPLDLKFETTYGDLKLRPRLYAEYLDAMSRNPKLRDGLNVSRFLNPVSGQLEDNLTTLPRAYFPKSLQVVADESASKRALETAEPAAGSILLGSAGVARQDSLAVLFVTSYAEGYYRIHYTAGAPALLKLTVPWYPGWKAAVDGTPLPVRRVDHALMGVVAPGGEHVMEFRFHSTWFLTGLVISGFTVLCLSIVASRLHNYVWKRIRL